MGFFDDFKSEKNIFKRTEPETDLHEGQQKEVPKTPEKVIQKRQYQQKTKVTQKHKKVEESEKIVKRAPKPKPEPLNLDDEEVLLKEIKELSVVHTTWRDYALMMLNSTAEPLRSIWREKIVTSNIHWTFNKGSISEGNVAGIEVLTVLPSELTESLVDDHFEINDWEKLERLNGSKRMNVFVGHYGQESFSNEANLCLKYIVNNWDNIIYRTYEDGDEKCMSGRDLIINTELLRRMWDLAQKSGGKCITDDEMLTYLLERSVDDNQYGVWIEASEEIFENGIPSEKYKKYWKSGKIEGYPLAEYVPDTQNWFSRSEAEDGTLLLEEIPLERQKENFLNMCDIFLKENVSWAACWKKICICILKQDSTMKYAGFGATLRERQARENAMAAFSTKQEEREKAKENAKVLAAKLEKENMENAKS